MPCVALSQVYIALPDYKDYEMSVNRIGGESIPDQLCHLFAFREQHMHRWKHTPEDGPAQYSDTDFSGTWCDLQ